MAEMVEVEVCRELYMWVFFDTVSDPIDNLEAGK